MACEHNRKIRCVCGSAYCKRHGRCCECVAYHRQCGDLPACLKQNK